MTKHFSLTLSNDTTSTGKHYHASTIHIKSTDSEIYLIDDGTEYHIKNDDTIHYQNLHFKIQTHNTLNKHCDIPLIEQAIFPQINHHQDPLAFLFKNSRQLTSSENLKQ